MMVRQITSLQHPLVKHFVKLRQNRDYRYEHHSVLIEGIKLIGEMESKVAIKTVIAQDESLIPKAIHPNEILIVNESIMHKISGLQSPEGILAEVTMPPNVDLSKKRFLIALDGVNDPGNMGTLLRSALALGWEGAFIVENSCDPFNEKSLRAARGATFRLPLAWGSWDQLKKIVENNRLQPIVADLKGIPVEELKIANSVLLVLGNEAQGVSPEARQLCQSATIPMPGNMESLNVAVAGGIMMYLLGKHGETKR